MSAQEDPTVLRPAPGLVSVIVPALDAAATLGAQLEALTRQDYRGEWEVIVADGGSSDATAAIALRWLERLPGGRLVGPSSSAGHGAGAARNRGADRARGDLLAFCDADDVAAPGWISGLARAATGGDVVAGRLDVDALNPPGVRCWHETPPWELERPIHRFLPSMSTANCAVWTEVFHALGGFDERRVAGEDRDFAWRAQLSSYRLVRAPDAVILYRYRPDLAGTARQHFDWGLANPRLYRRFRRAGMRPTRVSDGLWAWGWILASLPALPWSQGRRGQWVLRTAHRFGHMTGSVRQRVLFL